LVPVSKGAIVIKFFSELERQFQLNSHYLECYCLLRERKSTQVSGPTTLQLRESIHFPLPAYGLLKDLLHTISDVIRQLQTHQN
jgi:hypothetical protein